MWTLSDRHGIPGKRAARIAAILLVGGFSLTLGAGAAHAALQSADRPPATAQERSDLRQAIERHYEVLPVSGGVLLRPRQSRAGIRTLEVTGDQIAVNGERVSARTLRDWLGDEADPVLRLQAVPAAERRQLFGLSPEAATGRPEAAPAAAAAPEATPEPATSEEETSDTDVAETSVEAPEAPELPTPTAPEKRTAGSRVNVGGGVHVRPDEVADEVVAVGGSAEVEGDVRDGVTAVGGHARVDGKVGGDVISIGNDVRLGPHAVVEGDVTSVGGSVERAPGSVIHGSISEVGMGMLPFIRHRHFPSGTIWGGPWHGVSNLLGSLMSLVLTGLLVCLILLVARRPLERVDRQLVRDPWRAAAVGLAGSIFFWPLLLVVTVLLVITIIGCVLLVLYPFLLLYVALLLLLGYATVAYRLGRVLEARFSGSLGSPYAAALLGVLALQGWSVLGRLLGLVPGPFGFLAFLCWLFGVLAVSAAVVVGFGAVILSRFGLEPGYWPGRGTPPAPIVPAGPPSPPIDQLPLTDPLTGPPAGERWENEERYPEDPEAPR